jgi:hypothetical protein
MAKELSERACPVDSTPLLGVHILLQPVGKDARVRDPKTGKLPDDSRPVVPVCSKACADVVKDTDPDTINPDNFYSQNFDIPTGGGLNFLTK